MAERDDLERRLRAYESRIPDAEPPSLDANHAGRRAAFGAILAVASIAGLLLAAFLLGRPDEPVGQTSPPPSASSPFQSVTPSASAVTAEWGPLAVVGFGRTDAATEGILVVTDECTFVERGGVRELLVWPADRTRWNASDRSVSFETLRNGDVTIRDGDYVRLGGGGSNTEEDGQDPREWAASVDWVRPPADSCLVDWRWFVSDVASVGQPSPTPMPSPAAWIPLPDGGDDGLASVYGVTEWNGRLVATGSDGHARGAIWVSNDGIVWQSATVPDPPPDLGVSLGAPFVVGDRLMVFGTTFYPAGSGPVGSVAWTSTDGMAWTDTDASAQLGSSPLGLVGIRGQTIVAAEGHETPSGSAFWVSDDGGASWQRSAIDPDDGWWAIHGLAHGDGFVAVGTVFESFVDEPTATVWTSEDGLSWQRTALGPGRVNRIVEMGDGTLLVVGDDGEAPMGWTSTDGRTWSRSDIDLGCCGNEFTVTPSGFVAVQGADDGSGSVVYSSSDGLNWSVAGPLAGEMRRVAWTETFGVVISGLDTEGRPAVVVGWGTE